MRAIWSKRERCASRQGGRREYLGVVLPNSRTQSGGKILQLLQPLGAVAAVAATITVGFHHFCPVSWIRWKAACSAVLMIRDLRKHGVRHLQRHCAIVRSLATCTRITSEVTRIRIVVTTSNLAGEVRGTLPYLIVTVVASHLVSPATRSIMEPSIIEASLLIYGMQIALVVMAAAETICAIMITAINAARVVWINDCGFQTSICSGVAGLLIPAKIRVSRADNHNIIQRWAKWASIRRG